MVYGSEAPAKRPPGPKTPLEEALFQIKSLELKCCLPTQSLESLEVLSKLLYNAAVNPKEDKFRRVKLSNAKVNSTIVQVPGCLEALQEMGWVLDAADSECLVIAQGKFMTMAEVRKIEDAKDRVRRELRSSTSTAAAASTASVRVQA